ncbi:Aste57867_7444 [Aphanomyces stellatus]|uniref:Aste57867_7444 protein n=1 Tax=Aphanomyces stellatus TaxID=120398 RepID=A0A485KIB9_9STRA|nr:hypothetical protein As57867_007418 [Aphanomyces stellatus]VFT84356.1 Aste57867_7444 [Aphanomyces stellatus]
MILSQLWHYTAVLTIPVDTLTKWQSMVMKFIVGRKISREDGFMSPIHPGLAYDPNIGLKLPHIPSRVQFQRIQRLQLLVRSDHEESLLWTFLPKAL